MGSAGALFVLVVIANGAFTGEEDERDISKEEEIVLKEALSQFFF